MTDLEITKMCAEAIGLPPDEAADYRICPSYYNPLHDDAQAMALVKKLGLVCGKDTAPPENYFCEGEQVCTYADDLNRAICECVAEMQQSKHDR